jgi:hypothetical protein
MNNSRMNAIPGCLTPTDDCAEDFLVTRQSNVGDVFHQEGSRHYLLNDSHEGLPQLTASFIELHVLINNILVMLSPANASRKGLTGWAPSNKSNITAGIQAAADLFKYLRAAQIALV